MMGRNSTSPPLVPPESPAGPRHRVDLDQLLGDPFGAHLVLPPGQGVPGGLHATRVEIRRIGNGFGDPLEIRSHNGPVGDMQGSVFDTRLSNRLFNKNCRACALNRPGRRSISRPSARRLLLRSAGMDIDPASGILERLLLHGAICPTRGHPPAHGPHPYRGDSGNAGAS